MHNGLEDFENHGDDEASVDGISNQTDQVNSDPEQSVSESGSNNNEKPESESHQLEEGEGSEETQNENSDSFLDFFKLLPYLYLIQRSYNSNSTTSPPTTSPPELPTMDVISNNLFDSQSIKSLLHVESFRNQFQVNSLRYLQQLMPNGLGLNPVGSNGFHPELNDTQGGSEEENGVDADIYISSDHEEPLDLTQKNSGERVVAKGNVKLLRTNPRSERGYTIQDLEAALRDIKSGKLGTRRAAVIYGIPRSTLRNKVYKMGKNLIKPPDCHLEPVEKSTDREFGFVNGSISKNPYVGNLAEQRMRSNIDFMEREDYGNFTSEAIKHQKLCNDTSTLLRGDHSQSNSGEAEDTDNQMVYLPGRGYSHRGRHGSSSSLPLHTYPCVQTPGTSYDNYADSLGKKSRPKRGKYRNYDREALAKAVLAVQNGEMSVHRAGSYFGVPHSTLEYKVKERHLLRQAKFKGKSTSTPKPSSNKSNPAPGFSSVTSLSPSATADSNHSNESTTFQKTMPDLQRSLSHYLNLSKNFTDSRWNSPMETGLKEESQSREEDIGQESRKEIQDPLPKIYESSQPLGNNLDLLDLTRKT